MDKKLEAIKMVEQNNIKISPLDPRDYPMKAFAPQIKILPDNFEQIYPDEYLNQGSVSSCVTHATSRVLTRAWNRLFNKLLKFSVGFLYGYRPENQDKTAGTFLVDVLNNTKKYGAVLDSDFPYNEEVPKIYTLLEPLLMSLLKKALEYRITGYARLNNVDECKSALYQDNEIIIAIPLYENWVNEINWTTGMLAMPKAGAKRSFNHCMIVKGYQNKTELILMNSWGKDLLPIFILPQGYPINEMWMISKDVTPEKPIPELPIEPIFSRVIVDKITDDTDILEPIMKKLDKYKIPYCIDLYKETDKFMLQIKAFKLDTEAKLYLSKLNAKKSGVKFKIVRY